MPRSSFYYIVEHNPRDIADIEAIIDTNNREQLILIFQHKMEILDEFPARNPLTYYKHFKTVILVAISPSWMLSWICSPRMPK